ncbi:hypothetical protein TRVL_03491 [Trypanosoma vivax]|uniref:Uncharacterized protein n=1 Tax=Trypanosoma vivax (strain Y486) TaxID=1055687 RepID=G0U7Z6_TRYVY|nr:hypothetical protein TRVL_03491 [Trypanosoma vivax]CCC52004.1 hypothetical protein, unlikely [Trypanosoma vivax Y486]
MESLGDGLAPPSANALENSSAVLLGSNFQTAIWKRKRSIGSLGHFNVLELPFPSSQPTDILSQTVVGLSFLWSGLTARALSATSSHFLHFPKQPTFSLKD